MLPRKKFLNLLRAKITTAGQIPLEKDAIAIKRITGVL